MTTTTNKGIKPKIYPFTAHISAIDGQGEIALRVHGRGITRRGAKTDARRQLRRALRTFAIVITSAGK